MRRARREIFDGETRADENSVNGCSFYSVLSRGRGAEAAPSAWSPGCIIALPERAPDAPEEGTMMQQQQRRDQPGGRKKAQGVNRSSRERGRTRPPEVEEEPRGTATDKENDEDDEDVEE
jgi:hypothetical protein